jgi:NADP-dependent 3-hydroxy acid dehydrogenase YdfG
MPEHRAQDDDSDRPLALVTGASSGIGLDRQFVEHDFDVVITAEDAELAAAKSSLEGNGAQVRAVREDLSTADGVERLWSAVASGGRPLDAVAMNAGVGVNGDFTRDIPLEDDLKLIAVNVAAVVHLAKRALPSMVQRGAGRVLVTSSVAANHARAPLRHLRGVQGVPAVVRAGAALRAEGHPRHRDRAATPGRRTPSSSGARTSTTPRSRRAARTTRRTSPARALRR